MWKYILFDLDGTLTDPKEGLTKSIQYALEQYGIYIENLDELTPFIGPPLRTSFQEIYGFDKATANEAVAKSRVYFEKKGIYENFVFADIPKMLDNLKMQNKHIILATSKPKIYAEKILTHFDIYKYFDFISGSELDGTRTKKTEIIQYALTNHPIEIGCAVMIGDRKYDIIGALDNGINSVGVLYGYGDYEELYNANADYIVSSIEELSNLLLLGDFNGVQKENLFDT